MRAPIGVTVLVAVLAAGCVTSGTYNRKVAELDKLRADHDRAAAEREQKLQADVADLKRQIADLDKQLDDRTALAGELKKRLEKLGQNVDS